jgi:hypothetical protein
MIQMASKVLATTIVAGGICASGIAAAADPEAEAPPPVGASDWIVQVTPYLWASGMEGNISPFRDAPTIHVEKSFSDIMEDFNVGGFVNIWARRDRFVFSGDMMYVNTTSAKTTTVLPDLFPPVGAEISGELDSIEFNASAQAGYRVIDASGFSLDALAGGRFWYISNDATINTPVGSVSVSEDFNWIDPLIGARAFYAFNDRLSVMGQADIGGFGVGSDLTWSLLGTFNYVFNDKWSASLGYKYLSVDYDDDGYVFDVDLYGPVLGVTYRFGGPTGG